MNTSTLENLTRPERRRIQWELKKQQKRKGKPFSYTLPNRKSDLKTTAEEKELMQQTAEETLSVYLQLLPGLLEKLSRIPDPRNPNKVKHKMTLIILSELTHNFKNSAKMEVPGIFENYFFAK